jgi:hypothetical protein
VSYLSAKEAMHVLKGDVIVKHTGDGLRYFAVDTEPEPDDIERPRKYEIWVTEVEPDRDISKLYDADGSVEHEIGWDVLPGAESHPWGIGQGRQVVTYVAL